MGRDTAKREAVITAILILLAASFISLYPNFDLTGFQILPFKEKVEDDFSSFSSVSPVDLTGTTAPLSTKLTGKNNVWYDRAEKKYVFTYEENNEVLTQYEIDLDFREKPWHYAVEDGFITIYETITQSYPVLQGGLSYRKMDGSSLNPWGLAGKAILGQTKTFEHALLPNGIVSFVIKETVEGNSLEKRYDLEIRGKTILIHVHNNGNSKSNFLGNYQGWTFNKNDETILTNPRTMRVSYSETAPLMIADHPDSSKVNFFTTTYVEWTKSNSNEWGGLNQQNPFHLSYNTKYVGDGSQWNENGVPSSRPDFVPPIDDILYVTVSTDPEETLLSLHRPPSQYRADLAKRVWVEAWRAHGSGGTLAGIVPGVVYQQWPIPTTLPFENLKFVLEFFKSWGMDDLSVILFPWATIGYPAPGNEGCVTIRPPMYPIETKWGGSTKLREAADVADDLDYLFLLNQVYIDMYETPNIPGGPVPGAQFDITKLAKDDKGNYFSTFPNSNCGASTQVPGNVILPLSMSPDAWLGYMQDESPKLKVEVEPSGTYLDVHPKFIQAGIIDHGTDSNTKTYADLHQRIVEAINFQKNTFQGPLYGEGGSSESIQRDTIYAGLSDSVYGQAAKNNLVPVIPNVEIRQIKPIMTRAGMGHWNRWINQYYSGISFDTYNFDHPRATAIAFGHSGLMSDHVFFEDDNWNTYTQNQKQDLAWKLLKQYVKEYYGFRDLQEQYLSAYAEQILYYGNGQFYDLKHAVQEFDKSYFDNPQLKIVYANGMEIFVNRQQSGLWQVSAQDGKNYWLPANSWVAVNPVLGFTAFSGLADNQGNPSSTGNRIDYVKSENYFYVDPRGSQVNVPNPFHVCGNGITTNLLRVIKPDGLLLEEMSGSPNTIKVNSVTPCLTSLFPSSTTQGGVVTLTGGYFNDEVVVVIGGTEVVPSTVEDNNKITFTVPLGLEGAYQVSVKDKYNKMSNSFLLTIAEAESLGKVPGQPKKPSSELKIRSIEPNTVFNNVNNPIQVSGNGFTPSTQIRLDGVLLDLPITYFAPTLLSFTIPQGFPEATYGVSVKNSQKTASNAVLLTVQKPVVQTLSLTAISPSMFSKTNPVSVSLLGTGFDPGASVKAWGFATIQSSYVNSQRIDLINPQNLPTGNIPLHVENPDLSTTQQLVLTITS